jgi:hypothetical protein
VSVDHLSTPVTVPDLAHLTTVELSALRGFIASQMKEARKKSIVLLSKTDIRGLWMDTVTSKPTATEEEKAEILRQFQSEVLRYPEAFLAYAYANSLHVLDRAIWGEMVRRSK